MYRRHIMFLLLTLFALTGCKESLTVEKTDGGVVVSDSGSINCGSICSA